LINFAACTSPPTSTGASGAFATSGLTAAAGLSNCGSEIDDPMGKAVPDVAGSAGAS